ncbi:phosphotransferase [Streptomyces sp. IBSBF 2806]|uniref:phosphotransferase n=1 Tax=Streptomyces sp. IBSBF 2806 TaxID=2903529 RepID=UPI002FDC1677
MSAQSDVKVVAGVLALHYRIVPTDVCEGPSGTATSNYAARDGNGRRWFVNSYPEHVGLDAERRALELAEFVALGGVPVPVMRRTLGGNLIAVDGGSAVSVAAFAEGAEGAETAGDGLYGARWAAVGATVGQLHRTLARHPDGPPRRAPSEEIRDVQRVRQRQGDPGPRRPVTGHTLPRPLPPLRRRGR